MTYLRVKLVSVNSTLLLVINIYHTKFGLTEAELFTCVDHILGKVKKKLALLHPQPVLCGVLNN